jgi:hypothetical protein
LPTDFDAIDPTNKSRTTPPTAPATINGSDVPVCWGKSVGSAEEEASVLVVSACTGLVVRLAPTPSPPPLLPARVLVLVLVLVEAPVGCSVLGAVVVGVAVTSEGVVV